MKWFFIIFINILCTCVISALDEGYKKRIEKLYDNEEWTQKGFSTLEAMLKEYLAKHPAIEPCKNLIKLNKDRFTETLKCTSEREVYTPENGAVVTLDGSKYFPVPSMFRCSCLNPEHDFYILATTNVRLEKIYPDGIKGNRTAYSHWVVYTGKAIQQTYGDSDSYNQMADWYEKKFYENMDFTCQSFHNMRHDFERSEMSLAEAFVRLNHNKSIKIPGYLCCIFIDVTYILDFYFIATRPTFKWTRVFYSNDKFNDTSTFNIDY